MDFEKDIVELVGKVAEFSNLEERIAAKNTILDELERHKYRFRNEDDFVIEYDCSNCSVRFEEWELQPGENQPPGMLGGGMLCRPCWDDAAEEAWAAERE